jgi:phosphatidylserine decarboxylase
MRFTMSARIFAKFKGFQVSLTTFAAATLLRALPRVRISQAVGRLCDKELPAPVSRAIERWYCRAYGVNLEEAEPQASAYASFDAFFTRALRGGVRTISSDPVVSPADGRLSAAGQVDAGVRIFVKGQHYDVAELIGDARDAARYAGGEFAVVYLSPGDYHRVHSPVDGAVTEVRGIPGDLFPVNSIGERHIPRLFVRNNRVAIAIDTESLGRVTVVMVGAVIVGRISVSALPGPFVPPGTHAISPPHAVRRGDQLGVFHLGSTAVVLLPPGVSVRRPIGSVRYGESLSSSS